MTPHEKTGKQPRDLFVIKEGTDSVKHARLRPSDNHFYFDAVARHGSIRKAADAVHMASSALNRRILDLEQEVGTALFERLPRGVRLTAAGELLLNYVRWSQKELHKLEAQIDQLQGQTRGLVRIAVAESVTPSFLPDAIARYQRKHSGVSFHTLVEGPALLIDALMSDRVDLILTHDAPERPTASVLAVAPHPLCALVAPGHPLCARGSVMLSDCIAFPLALPDHSLTARALLDLAAHEGRVQLVPTIESDSIETLKAFARRGNSVCFSFQLGDEADALGLVPIPLRDAYCAEARLHLVARRGRVLPVAAASFAEQLKEALASRVTFRPVSVA